MKHQSSKTFKKIPPFHIFLTGGAGVGKLCLMKTMFL